MREPTKKQAHKFNVKARKDPRKLAKPTKEHQVKVAYKRPQHVEWDQDEDEIY